MILSSLKKTVIIINIISVFHAVLVSKTVFADQLYYTPKELVKMADVAISGTLVDKHQITQDSKKVLNVGVINISRHYKGLPESQKSLLIELAPYHGGVLSSIDVVLPEQAQGLWLLKKYPSGLYRLERRDALMDKQQANVLFKN